MTGEEQGGGDGQQPDPTADECVRAGMYWFGRSDFAAAQAWWERAIELDPRNSRAQECLRLLNKTSSTGFKHDAVNPFEQNSAGAGRGQTPAAEDRVPVQAPPSLDSWTPVPGHTSDLPPPSGSQERPPGTLGPRVRSSGFTPVPSGRTPASADPFDFAANGQQAGAPVGSAPRVPVTHSPWDDGPSRTSVVTLHDSEGFDAVPEPTPLPELDRERFFGREDPESRDDIVSFLKATGDLPSTGPLPSHFAEPRSQEPIPQAVIPPARAQPPADPMPALLDLPPPPPPSSTSAPAGGGRAPTGPKHTVSSRRPAALGPSGDIVFDDPIELDGVSSGPVELGPDPAALIKDARDRFGLHDFNGVLERLEALPPDLAQGEEARNLAAEARRNLLRMYESKIGDFEHYPRVLISDEEVIWLNLNHRAGFILSQIDGTVTFEDLVSLSGMPRLDTVRILADLIDKKVVG